MKIIDSLVNDEEFRATNEEKLEERNPRWLDTSVIVDSLVVKGRAGVGVGETPTDILSDCIDKLDPYVMDSVDNGDILRERVDMVMCCVKNIKRKSALDFLTKS